MALSHLLHVPLSILPVSLDRLLLLPLEPLIVAVADQDTTMEKLENATHCTLREVTPDG